MGVEFLAFLCVKFKDATDHIKAEYLNDLTLELCLNFQQKLKMTSTF